MDVISEQLKDFCDCLPEMDDITLEKNVTEMINLISLLTCWTQSPCETFLNSERTEIIDAEAFESCSCDDGIMDFLPCYQPFVPDTFKVSLIKQTGVTEEVTTLDPSDYGYSSTFGVLRIDLKDYIKSGSCQCPAEYKIVIKYDAGFELLPDCLLPLFCDLLHVISDKNKCDCSACQACKAGEAEVELIPLEVAKTLDRYLTNLLDAGYRKQLGLISLCGLCTKHYWGSVV